VLDLAWGASTHSGRVRPRNEDAVLARPPMFAVADGMGGYDAGDVASTVAVNVLDRLAASGVLSRPVVLDAVRAANDRLAHLGATTGRTLGTTLCGLAVLPVAGERQRLVLVNVGDSRAYRLRSGRLEQLTHDHSVVQEMLDAGEIGLAEAADHPHRHVVTRSLGGPDYLDIDWWMLDPEVDDRYLLASDGLTIELGDDEIRTVLGGCPDAATAATRLVEAALDRGGRDNISAVVVDVTAMILKSDRGLDPLDGDTHPRGGISWDLNDADRSLSGDTEPWANRALYADTEPTAGAG
jgi:serine/threonine protein phosphatase PrpC